MTTILIINAVSTVLAGLGMGGYLILAGRRARRDTAIKPVYVLARTARMVPRD
jgi:hypothetical protein